jgi:hypothetical protein
MEREHFDSERFSGVPDRPGPTSIPTANVSHAHLSIMRDGQARTGYFREVNAAVGGSMKPGRNETGENSIVPWAGVTPTAQTSDSLDHANHVMIAQLVVHLSPPGATADDRDRPVYALSEVGCDRSNHSLDCITPSPPNSSRWQSII